MRAVRALGDVKFILIGSVFVVIAIAWVYQTYSSLNDLVSDITLNPELSRDVIGLRLNTTGRQIGISFLMLAIGLSFVGWGIADYSQRASNRTTKLMVGGLYMISRRLEKLEGQLKKNNGSAEMALGSDASRKGK
ncbi:MAG: hypothetical protein R6T78_04115 [Dehalococcoidales bacterium]